MKKQLLLMITGLLLATFSFAQNTSEIPSVNIKTPNGTPFDTKDISNDGDPVIISFWALWCKPCIKELNAIAGVYEDWQDETGVKLYAVSIDDVRSSPQVMPFVNGNNWDYEILLDPNGDFKRAMNVGIIPHVFILDGNGKVVWQHTSYTEGGEYEMLEVLEKLAAGEEIEGH